MSDAQDKDITELKHDAMPGYSTAFYGVLAVCLVALGIMCFTYI